MDLGEWAAVLEYAGPTYVCKPTIFQFSVTYISDRYESIQTPQSKAKICQNPNKKGDDHNVEQSKGWGIKLRFSEPLMADISHSLFSFV